VYSSLDEIIANQKSSKVPKIGKGSGSADSTVHITSHTFGKGVKNFKKL
jgi:hypothetical protein